MKNCDRIARRASAEHQKARRKEKADQVKARQRASEIHGIEFMEKQALENLKKKYVKTIVADDLVSQVLAKAPKLKDFPYLQALRRFPTKGWVRSLEDWKPRGKSRDTQFISLAEHLLSKYKTPQFLWSAFFCSEHPDRLVDIVVHVAGGGSLYEKVQDGTLPLPFTRKLCHEFLKASSQYTFMSALRKTQVMAAGGDHRLFQIWNQTNPALRIGSAREEAFWATVLHFFAKTAMLDPTQITSVVDYIAHKYFQDPTFSMKGRSMLALMRDRDEWHNHLAVVKVLRAKNYNPSGFKNASYTKHYPNPGKAGTYQVNWRMFEILKAVDLADEGRAMRHCVYSYAPRIEDGRVSIWSLCGESKGEDLRYLTLEVNNASKAIVQIRGICNSLGKPPEMGIVALWASENGLSVSSYGRGW